MKNVIISIFVILLSLFSSKAAEIRFDNDLKFIEKVGGKWAVRYFPPPSISTDVVGVEVKRAANQFSFDLKHKPVVSCMLYRNDLYVCHISANKDGVWVVPRLTSLIIDLSELTDMAKEEWITFLVENNEKSSFCVELRAGKVIDILIDSGQVITVGKTSPKSADSIGSILVHNVPKGAVKLSGNLREDWSLNVKWSAKVEN